MIIATREEYLKRIGDRIGDTDEDIAFLEDMTDTYDSLYSEADKDTIQRLTAENDELRRKYKERFFAPSKQADEPDEPDEPEHTTMMSFEDLFKQED